MKKILIPETLRKIIKIKEILNSERDFRLYTASSAEEALEIHRREKVDLLVADLNMPLMGGDVLSSTIRNDDALKDVSIIIVCWNNKSAIERSQSSGANTVMTKPIDPDALSQKARTFLDIAKRKTVRIPTHVSVKGRLRGNFNTTCQNISTSGILLETDKILARGDKIKCSLLLPSEKITTTGQVVREVRRAPELYQYGVKFIALTPLSIARINEFINSN